MQQSTIYTVSYARYGERRWNRYANYLFAKSQNVVPIAAEEVAKAAVALPLAFIELEQETLPIAVLGLEPSINALVNRQGEWEGHYVPAVFRSYPFLLASDDRGHEQVLCFDESSGLLSETGSELFYEAQGKPAPFITKVLEFLSNVQAGRRTAREAARVLRALNLLTPWDIEFESAEGKKEFRGLFRVDEARLTHLSDNDFLSLREHGALALAYAQLVSSMHLPSLIKHVQAQIEARVMAAQSMSDLDFNSINFDDFKL